MSFLERLVNERFMPFRNEKSSRRNVARTPGRRAFTNQWLPATTSWTGLGKNTEPTCGIAKSKPARSRASSSGVTRDRWAWRRSKSSWSPGRWTRSRG
ncbi:MAG: hypothetical protein ACKOEQ_14075 [Verrucomicrobiota bacterium]